MIGLVFADESEGKTFYKKVTSKKTGTSESPGCIRYRYLTFPISQVQEWHNQEEEERKAWQE